tara:strand:- start:135 stop:536 length:402 start_codon:yes stop_codon:yes gene_type:complete
MKTYTQLLNELKISTLGRTIPKQVLRTANPKNIMKLPQNVGKTARTVDLMAKKYRFGDGPVTKFGPDKPGGLYKGKDSTGRPVKEPVLTSYSDVGNDTIASTVQRAAKAVQGVAKPVQGVVNIATKQRVRRRK